MTMSMDVARCRDLSRRDFARGYLAPSPRPVILTDALSNWRALGKWTPDYFGEHYGNVEVTIDGRTTLFVPAGWWHTRRMLTAAISVSVNSADAANWRAFKQDYCTDLAQERGRLRAAITSAYLGALGGLYSGLEFLNLFD